MTENELGKLLPGVGASAASPDPQQVAREVVRRDQRWIRALAAAVTLLWVLAAAGAVWLLCFYQIQIAPRLRAYAAGRAQLQNDWDKWALVGDWAAWSVLAFMLALLLAAVCTVGLILLSRRATLRQINASLAEISQQLRQLRPAQ
jgi:hypothetical protein